jgi:hypothetical protein
VLTTINSCEYHQNLRPKWMSGSKTTEEEFLELMSMLHFMQSKKLLLWFSIWKKIWASVSFYFIQKAGWVLSSHFCAFYWFQTSDASSPGSFKMPNAPLIFVNIQPKDYFSCLYKIFPSFKQPQLDAYSLTLQQKLRTTNRLLTP